jgi:hypothetical protein
MEEDSPYPRFASRGKAYVYVLPCRDEDLLKVGFSRDPFTRFSTLHRRFFDFFDHGTEASTRMSQPCSKTSPAPKA